ncbi:MAG: DUF2244 domain-containing protein [Xanthobacteraceae bacterium]|nr:MAG: DUF2244 domain-containing protein [Xanthobacteraceae bacterium]
MNPLPDYDHEPVLLSALLTPHRSLSGRGFAVVMIFLAAVSFVTGMAFLMMGAWPVLGFFGLDVALVYVAFRINYARAAAFEEIIVTPSDLHVRKVGPRGEVTEWRFNPLWVRLDRDDEEEFGITRLFLVFRGRRLSIAGFLGPDEKASFSKALGSALAAARRGAARPAPT